MGWMCGGVRDVGWCVEWVEERVEKRGVCGVGCGLCGVGAVEEVTYTHPAGTLIEHTSIPHSQPHKHRLAS